MTPFLFGINTFCIDDAIIAEMSLQAKSISTSPAASPPSRIAAQPQPPAANITPTTEALDFLRNRAELKVPLFPSTEGDDDENEDIRF